jgi:hypothetical protein
MRITMKRNTPRPEVVAVHDGMLVASLRRLLERSSGEEIRAALAWVEAHKKERANG